MTSNFTVCLNAEFERRTKNFETKYLSPWMFERLLDELALMIDELLRKELNAELGCALLYKGQENQFYLGGASSDRRRIRRSARLYNLDPNSDDVDAIKARESFTGYAISHYVCFVLDDFKKSCETFQPTIDHEPKKVEIEDREPQSYYFIPASVGDSEPKFVRTKSELVNIDEASQIPVIGGLRISSNMPNVATKVRRLLDQEFLNNLFEILDSGARAVTEHRSDYALAIADFQSDLLRYRLNEYMGLETLAFHLQSLFAKSECSVFIANEVIDEHGNTNEVLLNLAATTALADTDEHTRFRNTFFDAGKCYSCRYDKQGFPINNKQTTKTERAYFYPSAPVTANKVSGGETRSRKFPRLGEIPDCPSYLAVAIPSLGCRRFPYGVIRIVREHQSAFEEEDSRLAMAVARGLAQWVQFFPKNPALHIDWRIGEAEKTNLIQELFGLAKLGASNKAEVERAEQELIWLFQKIFSKSKRIEVSRILSGRSNATVLQVKNDHGLDLILKCSQFTPTRGGQVDELTTEIKNYQEYIEGKLPLNHNVIYPELIRETRRLKGFATSFLVPPHGVRLSLTEYCRWREINHTDLEWSLTRVVERLVGEVWAWWYKPENMKEKCTCSLLDFIQSEFLEKDALFSFFQNMEKFDGRLVQHLESVLGRKEYKGDGDAWPTPKELWERFLSHKATGSTMVTWQPTVTHGDTHGDNIFFDPRSIEMWIIDFGRTGYRPNVYDLAMIEADLKFQQLANLIGRDDHIQSEYFMDHFCKFEESLASQKTYENPIIPNVDINESKLAAIAKIVVDIRQLACQKLGRLGDFTDYQAISLLLAFKYMKLDHASPVCRAMAYLSAREIVDSLCDETL